MSGVRIGPGATPSTRIPAFASASASERMKARIATFLDEWSRSCGLPR